MPTVQPLTQIYLREDADFAFMQILNVMLSPVVEQVIKEHKPKELPVNQGASALIGLIPTENGHEEFMKGYKELCKPENFNFVNQAALENHFKDPNYFPLENYKIDLPSYQELTGLIQYAFADYHVRPSGQFYYPPNGFCGWHTNHNESVERLYISIAPEKNKSFFRYYENGKIITDWDNEIICLRRFKCPEKEPYFWHCVGSETDRISYGFRLFPKKL